jgi:hypothetical protein
MFNYVVVYEVEADVGSEKYIGPFLTFKRAWRAAKRKEEAGYFNARPVPRRG